LFVCLRNRARTKFIQTIPFGIGYLFCFSKISYAF